MLTKIKKSLWLVRLMKLLVTWLVIYTLLFKLRSILFSQDKVLIYSWKRKSLYWKPSVDSASRLRLLITTIFKLPPLLVRLFKMVNYLFIFSCLPDHFWNLQWNEILMFICWNIGDKKVVKGHGMPFYGDSISHGNLIITFKVEFPKRGTISEAQLKVLSEVNIFIYIVTIDTFY